MAQKNDPKLTLWMGKRAYEYYSKLETIGQHLIEQGVDVADPRRGGVSLSAVVRYLADEKFKDINSE